MPAANEMELVVILGRAGPKEGDWEPIRQMVISPCPPNANTQMPLQVRVIRRPAGSGEIIRTFLTLWADYASE